MFHLTPEHFHRLLTQLDRIERKVDKMAVSQAQLDAALAQEQTDLTTFLSAVSALIAKLNAGAAPADFSAELATVTAMDQAITAASSTDIPPATPPAGTPAS
jgi:hypothetical protein